MTTQPRTGHPYYMYDAIRLQPERVQQMLSDRATQAKEAASQILKRRRLHLVGIGTSWHAALVAEFWMREVGGWHYQAKAWNAAEFVAYPPPLGTEDAVVIITHSGAKGSPLQALDMAKKVGALTICLSSSEAEPTVQHADLVLQTCERENRRPLPSATPLPWLSLAFWR